MGEGGEDFSYNVRASICNDRHEVLGLFGSNMLVVDAEVSLLILFHAKFAGCSYHAIFCSRLFYSLEMLNRLTVRMRRR